MNRETLVGGQKIELTKEVIPSLRGMNVVELFLRIGQDPSLLLALSPEDGALVSELEEGKRRKEGVGAETWGKVLHAVSSGVDDHILNDWFEELRRISDLSIHSWCENFMEREGWLISDESSRYNFYSNIQMFSTNILWGIATEKKIRGF